MEPHYYFLFNPGTRVVVAQQCQDVLIAIAADFLLYVGVQKS
jgi:hypothetical protein